MSVEVRVAHGTVLVRSAGWWRWAGTAFAAVWGALLAINVVAALAVGDWLVAVVGSLLGLGGLHWALATFAASVEARADGFRVRAGLLRRYVASADVAGIRVVGPTFQSHYVLVVARMTGRPRRLRTVRQICTEKSRRALDAASVQLLRSLR